MEFVVRTLEEIFDKGPAEAYRIMMEVHAAAASAAHTASGGRDQVRRSTTLARAEGFPLRAGIEEA
jgi:ATP-dependent Clp protease adapter protein ClpS